MSPVESTDVAAEHPTEFTRLKAMLIEHDAAVLAEGPDWWKNDKTRPKKRRKKKASEPGTGKE